MQRYFAEINNNDVILSQDDIFHISKVMRYKAGDHIEIVDKNTHQAYLALIESSSPFKLVLQEKLCKNAELSAKVTLFFALAKSDKIELVIQKATELGAQEVILFQGKRSIVKFSIDDFKRKQPRYQAIAKEASEQCHREFIPAISYLSNFKDIKNHLSDVNLFAYELEAGNSSDIASIINKDKSISVIIGPEGGFDESEAEYLTSLGFKTISLGKRILRCETAAVYALSVLSYLIEK